MRKVKEKYEKDSLSKVVADSLSWSQVLIKLGMKQTGGNHRTLIKYSTIYGLDTSHMTGARWNKGLTKETNDSVANVSKKHTRTTEDIFKLNSTFSSSKLYSKLVKLGYKPVCAICQLEDWCAKPLRLHVDHVNGVHSDNRIENLRFICPNCHSQTSTYSGKNRKCK